MEFDLQLELAPFLGRLVTVWITAFILYRLYKWKMYEPINNYLEKRRDYIDTQVSLATKSNEQAAQYKEQQYEELKQARLDARVIVEKSKAEAIEVREDIIGKAKDEARNKVDSARQEIERERLQAKSEIQNEIVSVALQAAKEVVKDSLDEKRSKDIVDDFIKEMSV